jgi:hypothetical protein
LAQTIEETLAAGEIRFFDQALPRLDPGEYQVSATQQLDLSKMSLVTAQDPVVKVFTYSQTFHVTGARFGLGPADVHAVYPPPNSQGDFNSTLPHIVLRRRSLPWEQKLDAARRPWCALLLFHDGELTDPPQTVDIDKIQPTGVSTILAPALTLDIVETSDLAAARAVPTPGQAAAAPATPRCRVVDVDKSLFQNTRPQSEELDALAHVRQVSTADKELLGLELDGWFSVVICNRLPAKGLNTAHLVSLEGWLDFDPTQHASVSKVRLISLASWSFTDLPSRGNFKELMQHISFGPLQVPAPAALRQSPDSTEKQLLQGALNSGYVPLAYDMRHGEQTAAWYRGPLLPVVTPPVKRAPFPSVEAGMIYDSRTGMFDLSYAVAWQIGRLLALSDANFSAGIAQWRQDGHRLLDDMVAKERLATEAEEQQLWTKVGDITAAGNLAAMTAAPGHADEARFAAEKPLALQLLRDLLTPGVLSTRLAKLVIEQFDNKKSLARATVGSKSSLFTITAGVNDTLKFAVGSVAQISVTLSAGAGRGTDDVLAELNQDPQLSLVARAVRAQGIDGPIAIFSLDAATPLTILDGNANSTFGFAANAQPASDDEQPAAVLMRAAPDTKNRLTDGIAASLANVDPSTFDAAGPVAAKQLREQIQSALVNPGPEVS